MVKSKFLRYCSGAAFGKGQRGHYSVEVKIYREGIRLTGWLRHGVDIEVYRPNIKSLNFNYIEVRAMCERELPKYERWLNEWKAEQSGIVEECSKCDQPRTHCYCEGVSDEYCEKS